MKEIVPYTPYILFSVGQIIAFVIWIVSLQTKITKMEAQIEALKQNEAEQKKQSDWLRQQLQLVSEHLAVAKSVMENLILKGLKTSRP